MKHKIAIITTPFLEDFIRESLAALCLDFEYKIFPYRSFEEIREIYDSIGDDYDGFLTSGSFPAHMLQLCCRSESRPIHFFNTDEAAFYRLFLQLLDEDRDIDFNRVYADHMELYNIRVIDFIKGKAAFPDIATLSKEDYSIERMRGIEREYYEKPLKLWKEGKIDIAVSRFSSIVPALKEAGVRVYFPYPSLRYLKEICLQLLKEISLRKLEDQQPGIVILKIAEPNSQDKLSQTLEYAYLRLESLLLDHIGASILNYSVQRRQYGLEIVASKKDITAWTDGFRSDLLREFLRGQRSSLQLAVGYGLGNSIAQARVNAMDACHEAELKRNTSYLINEKGQMIGPLEASGELLMTIDSGSLPEVSSKLSPLSVKKIFAAMQASGSGCITARELALRLGITKRSANRYLAVLEEEGSVAVSHKTRATSKGRPESVYIRCEKGKDK